MAEESVIEDVVVDDDAEVADTEVAVGAGAEDVVEDKVVVSVVESVDAEAATVEDE